MGVKATKITVVLGSIALLFLGVALLLWDNIGEATFSVLCGIAALMFLIGAGYDRVVEFSLKTMTVKLREGLSLNEAIISIAEILAKFSQHTMGSKKQRKEREELIDKLMATANADKQRRERILEDAKLITELMATNDKEELKRIRKEVEARGLFD